MKFQPLVKLAVITIASIGLAACSASQDGGSGTGGDSDEPIVIGSSLPLTGAFAALGAVHKVAGEVFVERLNESGGLLGRQVEWKVLDDESVPDQTAAAYERLINEDQVDLLMGPYGTASISAAVGVAERYGQVLVQHSGALASVFTYDCHFPASAIGARPSETVPTLLFDALEAADADVKTVGFVTLQNPYALAIKAGDDGNPGAVEVAKELGYEVVLDEEYPANTADWAPIAQLVRAADPDLLVGLSVGLDPVNIINAMESLDYRPDLEFYLAPAPGPLVQLGDVAEGVMSVSLFEPNSERGNDAEVQELIEDFATAGEAEGIYPVLEHQTASSFLSWETLVQGVEGAGSTDQEAICSYLQENEVDSLLLGEVEYGSEKEEGNWGRSYYNLKQVQDGEWTMVYPSDVAEPDVSLTLPTK